MSDLISRSALLARYDRIHVGAPGAARKMIEEAPTIDAVPVVRCKDCKHWSRNVHVNKEHGLCRTLSFIGITMHENDFCSRGERKNDNGDNESK